jgi:hypothetical protein
VFVQPDHAVTIADFKKEVLNLDNDVGAVVIDFDLNINYIKMMKAVLHLRDPDCFFVVGGLDVKVPIQDEMNILGKY